MNDVKIRPYTPADEATLRASCEGDNHLMFFPTHVVEKGGEIIGSLSINAVPTVYLWMHTEKAKARDSVMVQNFLDNFMATFTSCYMVPCVATSPYFDYMKRVGYLHGELAGLFFRKVV